jgi:hypothetical protein
MFVPIPVLNELTKDFPIRVEGLDYAGYATVQTGNPNPVPDQPRHSFPRRARALDFIREQFFEAPNGPQRYLWRITTYPHHDDFVFEYIYIDKSVDWISRTLVAVVTLQEFETRTLDNSYEENYAQIESDANRGQRFVWFPTNSLRRPPSRPIKNELRWPDLYSPRPPRPLTPHPMANRLRIHSENDS